ncbi:hypothetical protein [Waddlia chondrophila]|uniref:Uncharacterized protein n=1 Tax=Waddlia chondrophila (strain ATCC VR-1470 / WSU 86-1044) TaxID=716544 RepID=D6YSU7_WADCW|nr:hypothetical protein [Waddlia chondrophila]ADI39142.1 hypothetical protein wcw_1803 [Waddlia chondrophila WSU 86-1044]
MKTILKATAITAQSEKIEQSSKLKAVNNIANQFLSSLQYKSILFVFLLLIGCGERVSEDQKISPLEKKIFSSIERGKLGQSTSPIIITPRKLSISEIGHHLDMDEETVLKHLKATNIHGYYSLSARNLPPEGIFTLYHINFEGKMLQDKKFFVNGNGILVTKLDDQFIEINNNLLFFSNYLPGEPVNFALVSEDQKLIATTKIVPNPIEKVDNHKHRISLEIASPDKRTYVIHCSGLRPFGTYLASISFENERFAYPFEANSKGEAFLRTGPSAPWITEGEGTLELRGDQITNPLFLEFFWGS